MSKIKTVFVCQNCGWHSPRWQGQCSDCNEWNTLVEEIAETRTEQQSTKTVTAAAQQKLVAFTDIMQSDVSLRRISTGIGEFDRVLGGADNQRGMVEGGVYLIGGEPGIGKSTLLTQVVLALLKKESLDSNNNSRPILYVCGEESPTQISLRIKRMIKKEHINIGRLKFVTTTDVAEISTLVTSTKPELIVIDSIQTVTTAELSGAAGSVGQIREAADRLTRVAKQTNVPMFLVGHVTKEGVISGPKILEHIVDAVLELSGERSSEVRLLRAIKNRFGATDEVGVFQVAEDGYVEVSNPSTFFIDQDREAVAGSAIVCVMEGTRPLLVEVQALVVSSQLPTPRRIGRGVDISRIQVLAAVLQRHCRINLSSYDIFVSVAGGFTVKEPAADLGIALAMASSFTNKAIPANSVAIGEVGLLGELRTVALHKRREKESKRLGFSALLSKEKNKTLAGLLSAMKQT